MNKLTKITDLLKNTSFMGWLKGKKGATNAQWESWLKKDIENKEMLSDIILIEKGIPFKKQANDKSQTKESWERLAAKINKPAENSFKKSPLIPRRNWLKIAASIAIIIATIWTISIYANQAKLIQTYTNFAENQTIELPDGSIVVLGANSGLAYYDNFKKAKQREVELEGEAYFKVAKQGENKQFIVKIKDLEIKVIGTEFNVNSHRDASIISLTEGKIALTNDLAQKELIAGQTASFNQQTKQFEIQEAQTEYWSAWRFQKWSFGTATPLPEIIQRIEETFGLICQVENPLLLDKKAKGEISIDNPEVLFESLSVLLNIEIEKSGSELIFRDKIDLEE